MAEYINRKKATDLIDNYGKTVDKKGKVVVDAIRDMFSVILPNEDVEPIKHGKWAIYEENDFDYEEPIFVNEDNLIEKSREHHYLVTVPMCSICHSHALLNGCEEYVLSNYCPDCGAKMDLKE